ncbi:ribulose bisphosphate carboxylase small subunit [Lyngbya confervoides]|uniref:Ribulose bisphosphate carboxylase small subunit n=1 Tax=Lyngbya confervoides BDU141951 TaxID=1574623 RepID=A0ABD4T3D5_9CYAN|nr:ribulose bisphosphate carboxylase small subunit [Lyngbya confervoides]MCM1983252.1 ribulose bisphosphate carboxylase small subunit [Lyngbya confervoides BDU141951]
MTFYIAPRFLQKLSVHITKNFIDLPKVKVPLILGIHGRKGEGKTFQCELVYQKMGLEVVHISAGELESPDAGDPSRLVRLRYREAAELIRVRGKMAVLMINDLDAGAGRVDSGTQYTVNTQMVNATLMNIADNPTNVQLPGSYDETPLHRVPIVVTGNDFATLYAPLVRDGRMEKFYWEPSREDKIGIVGGIFSEDGLSSEDVVTLVDHFLDQSVDFYGALRSRLFDEQIEEFIHRVGVEKVGAAVVNTKHPPAFRPPNFSLGHLLEQGELMVKEQQRLQNMRLVWEYNQALYESRFQGQESPVFFSSPHSRTEDPPATVDSQPGDDLPGLASGVSSPEVGASAPQSIATSLDSDLARQVQSLVAQGYPIGIEYVDPRRFHTGTWKSCHTIPVEQAGEALAQLSACLQEHQGNYVRIFGIDSAKRRVLETVVQRP